MNKTEYSEYLNSEHWKQLRKDYINGDCECMRCRIPRWLAIVAYDQDLSLHHLSYAHLWQETYEDLEVVCRRCHEIEHFGKTSLKAPRSVKCLYCDQLIYNVFRELQLCTFHLGWHEVEQEQQFQERKRQWEKDHPGERPF